MHCTVSNTKFDLNLNKWKIKADLMLYELCSLLKGDLIEIDILIDRIRNVK